MILPVILRGLAVKQAVVYPVLWGERKKNILPKGRPNLNLRVVEEGAKW
jgi:hypothetical protein